MLSTAAPRVVTGGGAGSEALDGAAPAHLAAHGQFRSDLAARLEHEVETMALQVRAGARQHAAATGGIVMDTRARIGYTAPIVSTDEDRRRRPTVTLPPRYVARHFEASCD